MVNRQLQTLKLRDRILQWKLDKVWKEEKQKKEKQKNISIQLFDSI